VLTPKIFDFHFEFNVYIDDVKQFKHTFIQISQFGKKKNTKSNWATNIKKKLQNILYNTVCM
jgi:hypothetical protein